MQMMRNCLIQKIFVYTTLALIFLQVGIIIGSWIAAAAMPESSIRSLISGDGIRWFLGMFTNNVGTPVLVWIILIGFAFGSLNNSGLANILIKRNSINARIKFGLKLVVVEVICFIIIILLLTITPHAILLSVTGTLFPSSFTRSLIPVLAFAIIIFSLSFGIATGKIVNLVECFSALISGINLLSPIFLVYVVASQLYSSILWVMQW
jgi:p-aminobenzoyl-glutamate transporter AbgT